jgi:hypothetical protein
MRESEKEKKSRQDTARSRSTRSSQSKAYAHEHKRRLPQDVQRSQSFLSIIFGLSAVGTNAVLLWHAIVTGDHQLMWVVFAVVLAQRADGAINGISFINSLVGLLSRIALISADLYIRKR